MTTRRQVIATAAFAAAAAPLTAAGAQPKQRIVPADSPRLDFRATWVNFGRADITRAGHVGPNTVAQSMAAVGAYGFNVCHQAFLSAFGADYPSTVVRRRTADAANYIQQAVDAKKASGVAVHPWIKTLVGSFQDNSGDAVNSLAQYRASGWIMQTLVGTGRSVGDIVEIGTGDRVGTKWISPAIPAARAFIKSAIVDMVRQNPGIDGIVLDFCRYPSQNHMGCYSAASRAWFETWSKSAVANWPTDCNNTGSRYTSWKIFHTFVITSFVAEVAAACRAVKPTLQIGCAPFPKRADRNLRLQYPDQWARAGSIDYMETQCYTQHGAALPLLLAEAKAEVEGTACKFYPLLYTLGTTTHLRDPATVYQERRHVRASDPQQGMGEFSWVTEYASDLPETLRT